MATYMDAMEGKHNNGEEVSFDITKKKSIKEKKQDIVTLIIERVGSKDLIRQKKALINLISRARDKGILGKDSENMEGLLNFLDACTDQIKDGKAIVKVNSEELKVGDKVKILPTINTHVKGEHFPANKAMKSMVGNVYRVSQVFEDQVTLKPFGFIWKSKWLEKTDERLTKI